MFPEGSGRNRMRLEDRKTSELVGICRGILADGAVCGLEATFLLDWIERTQAVADEYPFTVLYERLADAMVDGVLDSDEELALLTALTGLVGGEAGAQVSGAASLASTLPLCSPAPEMVHSGRNFVVTGTFERGSRTTVTHEIASRGGVVQTNVTLTTHYLVIGSVASRDWVHSSYGRKIQKAMEDRAAGSGIAIVSESHWAAHL